MYTFTEFFCGCGGMSIGLIRAGLIPVHLYDIDHVCIQTLRENGYSMAEVCDIRTVERVSNVDIIVGGIPCQAWSHSGKRMGLDDSRGSLFLEFIRVVNASKPKMFIIENVHGLLTHNKGETFKTLMNRFDGYTIHSKLLNAWDYGVAQIRKRVFIIGILNGLEYTFPDPLPNRLLLRDALKDVPASPGQRYSDAKKAILNLVPPGGCWVDIPPDIQRAYMGRSFTASGGRRGIAKRLSWDAPSPTLLTNPNSKQSERCHPDETRPLTIREYARIQTFPDSYMFSGSMIQQYRQIGNAVPVELAYHLGRSLIGTPGCDFPKNKILA